MENKYHTILENLDHHFQLGVAILNSQNFITDYENQLFFGTVDARLISLNIKTGAKIWDKKVVGNQVKTESISSLDRSDTNRKKKVTGGTGVGISMAPVVYKNQVIIGITYIGSTRNHWLAYRTHKHHSVHAYLYHLHNLKHPTFRKFIRNE